MPFKRYNIFLRSKAHLQNSIENISLNFGNNSVHMNMIAREICSWISGYLTQQSFGTLPNWGPRPIVPMVTLAKMTALVLILGFSDTLSQKSPLGLSTLPASHKMTESACHFVFSSGKNWKIFFFSSVWLCMYCHSVKFRLHLPSCKVYSIHVITH